ncbi:hypothetical protein Tco_0248418 [Tanacetum coccineum]
MLVPRTNDKRILENQTSDSLMRGFLGSDKEEKRRRDGMHAGKNIELNYGQREADPSDHVTWLVALGDDVIW